jgi:drug/metabolite transporter (DMT)-like permease
MQTAATGQSKNKSSLPPVMKDKVDIRSWALLLSLTVIWGTSYILMKKALLVYTPIEMASLRLTVAGLVCIPFLPRAVKHIPFSKIGNAFFVGGVGSGIPAFLFAFAMSRITSSVGGIINSQYSRVFFSGISMRRASRYSAYLLVLSELWYSSLANTD